MTRRWFRLDTSRSFTTEEDCIFYWENYDPPYKNFWNYTHATSLILNLKKKEAGPYVSYRKKALWEASEIIKSLLLQTTLSTFTVVPMPTSDCVGNYDARNRLHEILELTRLNLDVKNLFCFNRYLDKTHMQSPSMKDPLFLKFNMSINKDRLLCCRSKIVLFDDVLTTGAHFNACKSLILENRDDVKVYGMMLTVTR